MFFPERIRLIKKKCRVLEIGPGNSPHPRSNVLLERTFNDEEALKQRGGAGKLKTSKNIIFYDGGRFPFEDYAFDYVICSHVIEHVDDVESFCSEMFRVAKCGYLEYPTLYYEYLYNFSVHTQLINFSSGELLYMPKAESGLREFQPVHAVFNRTLELGYSDLVDDLKNIMFQGFEWSAPFRVRRAKKIEELSTQDLADLKPQSKTSRLLRRIIQKFVY